MDLIEIDIVHVKSFETSIACRKDVFATQALAQFANDPSITNLIANKNRNSSNLKVYRPFQKFLEKWGSLKFTPQSMNLIDFINQFQKSENVVGLKTLKAFQGDAAFDKY